MRDAKNVDLKEAEYKWYKQMMSTGTSVVGVKLQNAAEHFAESLGIDRVTVYILAGSTNSVIVMAFTSRARCGDIKL